MANAWGGSRPNSGRPKGSGKYGLKTKHIRVPEVLVPDVLAYVRERVDEELRKRCKEGVEPARAVPAPTSFRGDTAIGSAKGQ